MNDGGREYVEFQTVSSLYSEPDNKGKQKLIKSSIVTKISMYVDDIQAHEEAVGRKGNILKNNCKIYHRNLGTLIVKASYNEISDLKTNSNKPQPAGFKKQ